MPPPTTRTPAVRRSPGSRSATGPGWRTARRSTAGDPAAPARSRSRSRERGHAGRGRGRLARKVCRMPALPARTRYAPRRRRTRRLYMPLGEHLDRVEVEHAAPQVPVQRGLPAEQPAERDDHRPADDDPDQLRPTRAGHRVLLHDQGSARRPAARTSPSSTLSRSGTLRNRYAAKTPSTSSVSPQSARAAGQVLGQPVLEPRPRPARPCRGPAPACRPTRPHPITGTAAGGRRTAASSARVEAPEPQPRSISRTGPGPARAGPAAARPARRAADAQMAVVAGVERHHQVVTAERPRRRPRARHYGAD